ncbi:hypothetical protein AB0933_16550 [Streptomyces venezuelae]|uniref:hypothetical protein n=1 Tax=Streptomyces venezuelae TaxID=54571 RepID=UPI0034529B4E
MIEHRDGLAWIETDGDGPEYFGLVFGQGVSPRELAVRLGAPEDSPVLDPATIERIEQAWPTHRYDEPNIGRIGDAGNGWSFCLLPCAAMETSGSGNPFGADGSSPSKGIRTIEITDTGMDPANIIHMHDETYVWSWFDGDSHDRAAEPDLLADRLRALGLPTIAPGTNLRDLDEETRDARDRQYEIVYRAISEHFGIGLPREEVTGRTLPGMVCEPREIRNARHAPEGPTERNPTWDRLRALGFDL